MTATVEEKLLLTHYALNNIYPNYICISLIPMCLTDPQKKKKIIMFSIYVKFNNNVQIDDAKSYSKGCFLCFALIVRFMQYHYLFFYRTDSRIILLA